MPVMAVAWLAVVGIFLKRFNLLMVAFNTPYDIPWASGATSQTRQD
jgi:hypothetical protein